MAAPYPSFPASPTIGQTYTDANGAVWTFGNIGWTKTLVSLTSDPSIWQNIDSALSYDSSGNVTITGGLTAGGNVNIDSGTFYVDAVNNNVGIGTITPNTIGYGGTVLGLYAGSNGGGNIWLASDATAAGYRAGRIGFGTEGNTTNKEISRIWSLTEGTTSGNLGGNILFSTKADGGSLATRLTLDASGNLGLGVTPSDYLNTVKAIDISSAGAVIAGSANIALAANAFLNSSGNWIYKNSSTFAAKYTPNFANNGSHVWEIAPSGTAGNPITFTQAMTLDASGNLGLGTPSLTNSGNYSTFSINGSTGGQIAFQTGAVGKQYIYSTATDITYRNDNGATIFFSGSERVRIDSSGRLLVGTINATANGGVLQVSNGITFPATQSACSDANTLDDYEEGTFTPTYTSTSGSAGSATYTSNGKYTKIGNVVTVWGDVTFTNKGSWTGFVVLGGLPFTSASGRQYLGACWFEKTTIAAQTFYQSRIGPSETNLVFAKTANGGIADYLDVASINNDTILRFTTTYAV